ncbi:MAG: MazG-like family protein [Pseudomonadota bacterium]
MTLEINKLVEACKQRDYFWDPEGKLTPAFRGNELAGETGEACNVIKKLERARLGINGSIATVEELAKELGDVLICAALIAMTYNIDLAQATKDKFNESSKKLKLPVVLY